MLTLELAPNEQSAMDPKDVDLLSNESLPEAVRVALVQSLQSQESVAADRELEAERLRQDRRKFMWNTPVVATLAGLVTLSATFIFDRYTAQDDTRNAITLEEVRAELSDNNAALLKQLEQERALTDAEIAAQAGEREFQYKIIEAELSNEGKDNAERAAVLLFLVRAGVLNTLNRPELEEMTQLQIDNPSQNIIPRLTGIEAPRGIIGEDDARPGVDLSPDFDVQQLARSVGQLLGIKQGKVSAVCTAFLIAPDQIATADYCIGNYDRLIFTLEDGSETSEHEVEFLPSGDLPATDNVIAVLAISPSAPAIFPPLSFGAPPAEDARLGAIYFRADSTKLAIWGNDECRLVSLSLEEFQHSCDTGAGTGGSPIFDPTTRRVIGVHYKRAVNGGVALRADHR